MTVYIFARNVPMVRLGQRTPFLLTIGTLALPVSSLTSLQLGLLPPDAQLAQLSTAALITLILYPYVPTFLLQPETLVTRTTLGHPLPTRVTNLPIAELLLCPWSA